MEEGKTISELIVYWGSIGSIAGVFISLVGFAFTIRNVLKSKSAAQAAQQAVQQVREDVRRIDTVSELTEAISVMNQIKTLHREATWGILPDRYTALRKLLISIHSANPNLSDEHKTTIQGAIQHFKSIERTVEKYLAEETEPANIVRLNTIVSQQVDGLVEILVEIQHSIGV